MCVLLQKIDETSSFTFEKKTALETLSFLFHCFISTSVRVKLKCTGWYRLVQVGAGYYSLVQVARKLVQVLRKLVQVSTGSAKISTGKYRFREN